MSEKKKIHEFLYFIPLYFMIMGIAFSTILNIIQERISRNSIWWQIAVGVVIMIIYGLLYTYYIKLVKNNANQ